MKKAVFFTIMLMAVVFWILNFNGRPVNKNKVNMLLGNESYIKKFGAEPGETTSEQERIQTHLLYVESLLRERSTATLTTAQLAQRTRLLNLLHEYAVAGNFPNNAAYPGERKPCFIGDNGNICAVGYLVEQTAGRAAAEEINERHKYETIYEMQHDQLLQNWVAQSGLTLEECALIQPTYGWPNPNTEPDPAPNDQVISKSYGVTTGISAGFNLALNAVNQFQVKNGARSKLAPVLGLATGAFSVVNGIRHYPRKPVMSNNTITPYPLEESNDTKKLISVGNIALGSVTMILSTWNLIKNKHQPARKISWQPYYQPLNDGKAVYGVGLTKRIG